jgi:iron complex outermembrane recepter protein
MKVLKRFFVVVLLLSPVLACAEINLDDIVVTPSRMAQRNYKVASNVTVIDSEQIAASGAQTVVDILKESMATSVYDKGSAKSSTVDIRGFADTAVSNVLVLVDDRKVNSIDIAGPDLLQIPLNAVERIEILRGAGSVLYGDNAVGGVINIITKKGKGDFKGRVGSTYGSYDSRSIDLEGSGSRNDISYYLYSKYDDARGYRQNSDSLRKDFNTKLGYDFTDRISTRADVIWHEDRQELPSGLSGSEIARFSRRHSMSPDDFSDTKDRLFNLGFEVTPWPEDIEWGKFDIDLSYRNRDVYDAFFEFGEFSTKRNIDTYGVTGKYVFDHEVFNHDVNFVTGVDYYDTANDIVGSGSNADDITISKREIGAFANAQYEAIQDMYINLGTRYNTAKYDFDQRNVVVNASQEPDIWVSGAGVRYDYAPGSNIHASAQETFRFLATDEWYSTGAPAFGISPLLNIYMDQQRGTQLETGIKHNLNNGVVGTVTLYQIDLDNEIYFDPLSFANGNYAQTRRRGIEVGQETDILKFVPIEQLDAFEFLASYNYQDARFIDGVYDDNRIPMVARSQAKAGLTLGFFKNYKASFIGRYTSSRNPINDQANSAPVLKPYFVMDTKLTYERGPIEAFFAVNNLFDKKYDTYSVVFGSARDFFPAPERNFTTGVNVKF